MEKAILIGVQTYTSHSFEERMEEMKELALACDIEICMSVSQNLEHPHKKYYMNPGKIEEVKRILEDQECSMVLVLEAISPSVQRNLSDFFDCEVMDKSALILEIFASRAKTKESMLQVECARLKYLLPRLQGSYKHMDRQRGGSRNKGTGEKKIELDARRIEGKIHFVEKELDKIHTQRSVQRNQRKKGMVKSVALTGYTNAGKSSIMNGFVNEDKSVFEKDMLFATLTTSTRQIETENHNVFTLSDTVGFISDLPHSLVQAFHSTLEEAVVSDLILKVVDISEEDMKMMAGFGGGMFIGSTCGALVGSIAALSKIVCKTKAHEMLPELRPLIQKHTRNFKELLGSLDCAHIKPVHHSTDPNIKCMNTCLLAAKALEKTMEEEHLV